MPYPTEHAARIEDPGKYKTFNRVNNKFGSGIDAIFGKKDANSPMELQAIRFDKTKFTPAQAKAWLKDHKQKYQSFEAASDNT